MDDAEDDPVLEILRELAGVTNEQVVLSEAAELLAAGTKPDEQWLAALLQYDGTQKLPYDAPPGVLAALHVQGDLIARQMRLLDVPQDTMVFAVYVCALLQGMEMGRDGWVL